MLEQERVKLLFGPYRTPKCKVGRGLRCIMRGKVTVAGLSDAPIRRLLHNHQASARIASVARLTTGMNGQTARPRASQDQWHQRGRAMNKPWTIALLRPHVPDRKAPE